MTPPEKTFHGPAIDNEVLLSRLPDAYQGLLRECNGFVMFGGGLHVRGVSASPEWHSLDWAWAGEDAFHRHYHSLTREDIPFGQDCVGDQFLLRNDRVIKLYTETGDVEDLGMSLQQFIDAALATPLEILGMHPLIQFQRDGNVLKPGQLLSVWPPSCAKESENGVSLKAIPAIERVLFLAELSAKIADVPDGEPFKIEWV